jgi:hypothetical protein
MGIWWWTQGCWVAVRCRLPRPLCWWAWVRSRASRAIVLVAVSAYQCNVCCADEGDGRSKVLRAGVLSTMARSPGVQAIVDSQGF